MLTNLLRSLASRAGKKAQTHASIVSQAHAALAANPGAAVRLVRQGWADGIVDAEACLSLGVFLLESGNYEIAKKAFAAPPSGWHFPVHTSLKFKAHSALTEARCLSLRGVIPKTKVLGPGPYPVISVIICSVSPELFARAAASYRRVLSGVPHEIVGIYDARSLCEGYNRGARKAVGDILIFSHDDVEVVGDDFAAKLLDAMSEFELVGIAGTTMLAKAGWISAGFQHIHGQVGVPHLDHIFVQIFSARQSASAAQALDGCFLSARRHVWETLGFDEETFRDWHLYDIDFSYRAHARGYSSGVRGDLLIHHHASPMEEKSVKAERWRSEAKKFLVKFPHLESRPENFDPSQLVSIRVADKRDWALMLQQLHSAHE